MHPAAFATRAGSKNSTSLIWAEKPGRKLPFATYQAPSPLTRAVCPPMTPARSQAASERICARSFEVASSSTARVRSSSEPVNTTP